MYTVVYGYRCITCFLQMSFRNVALVFGPTLVRGAAQDMLTSMNESYIIVEALCRHVSVLCWSLARLLDMGMHGIYKL